MLVAAERELRAQRIDVELLALRQKERKCGEIRWRRETVECGRRRDEEHVALAARRVVERSQPLGHQILMRRKVIVGQSLPVGQRGNAQARREPCDLRSQPLCCERLRADDRGQLAAFRGVERVLRQRERVRRTGQRRGERLPAGERALGQQARQRRQSGDAGGCRQFQPKVQGPARKMRSFRHRIIRCVRLTTRRHSASPRHRNIGDNAAWLPLPRRLRCAPPRHICC